MTMMARANMPFQSSPHRHGAVSVAGSGPPSSIRIRSSALSGRGEPSISMLTRTTPTLGGKSLDQLGIAIVPIGNVGHCLEMALWRL